MKLNEFICEMANQNIAGPGESPIIVYASSAKVVRGRHGKRIKVDCTDGSGYYGVDKITKIHGNLKTNTEQIVVRFIQEYKWLIDTLWDGHITDKQFKLIYSYAKVHGISTAIEKLKQLYPQLVFESMQSGTYAAVQFDKATINVLLKIIKDNNIPNGLTAEDFHSTICYSRKELKNFKTLGKFSTPWVGTPTKFGVFANGDKSCAILFYNCKKQTQRFNYICKEYGAKWDYENYECHVTLSYDIEDFDMKQLNIKQVPLLSIVSEYTEDL